MRAYRDEIQAAPGVVVALQPDRPAMVDFGIVLAFGRYFMAL